MIKDVCKEHYKGFLKTSKRILGEAGAVFKGVYDIVKDIGYLLKNPSMNAFKIRDYDELSQQYTDGINTNTDNRGMIQDLGIKIGKLSHEKSELEKKIEENPIYKKVLNERDDYKKQTEDRGKLIDYLKYDKKGLINIINQVLDKTPESLISFLQNDAYFSKQPLLFVNSHGIIIGSTEALKKKLKINYDLTGKNCYDILRERYPALKTDLELKSFFNTYNARDFNTTFKDGKNETNLHILKQEPVLLKNLDLKGIGRDKIINPIAFIPVLVYPIGTMKNFIGKSKSLDRLVAQHKKVYYELNMTHKWTPDEIYAKENELGFDYLVEQDKILTKIKKAREKNQKGKI
ncbi:MAG: hypothetical protein AABW67_00820 [Nanoarchaeota archaeon]